MIKLISSLLVALTLFFAAAGAARADGCYTCGTGSTNGCQECRYKEETWAARHDCEAKGCKVSGTTSCSTASNVKVCSVQKPAPILACARR